MCLSESPLEEILSQEGRGQGEGERGGGRKRDGK